jgi:hypothetical protein
MVGVIAVGQNSLRTEGRSLITVTPSSLAASTGSATLPVIPGAADVSLQIVPVAGGSLTSDSTYGTFQVYISNSLGAYAVWSEPKVKAVGIVATGADATVDSYYSLRDTLANSTVALSSGLIINIPEFQGSRIKVVANRPQSTDSVNYYVYYVYKYRQNNPR